MNVRLRPRSDSLIVLIAFTALVLLSPACSKKPEAPTVPPAELAKGTRVDTNRLDKRPSRGDAARDRLSARLAVCHGDQRCAEGAGPFL